MFYWCSVGRARIELSYRLWNTPENSMAAQGSLSPPDFVGGGAPWQSPMERSQWKLTDPWIAGDHPCRDTRKVLLTRQCVTGCLVRLPREGNTVSWEVYKTSLFLWIGNSDSLPVWVHVSVVTVFPVADIIHWNSVYSPYYNCCFLTMVLHPLENALGKEMPEYKRGRKISAQWSLLTTLIEIIAIIISIVNMLKSSSRLKL